MGLNRLQSKHLDEVALVGGPWCGMNYAILKTSICNQIEVPGRRNQAVLHRYERDEEDGLLFYYTGDVV